MGVYQVTIPLMGEFQTSMTVSIAWEIWKMYGELTCWLALAFGEVDTCIARLEKI